MCVAAVEVACRERPGNIDKLVSRCEEEAERNEQNITENSEYRNTHSIRENLSRHAQIIIIIVLKSTL